MSEIKTLRDVRSIVEPVMGLCRRLGNTKNPPHVLRPLLQIEPDQPQRFTEELVTLDTLLDGRGAIDILKVDVDGQEPCVVRGADATLRAGRVAMVIFEVSDLWRRGPCATQGFPEVVAHFDRLQYDVFILGRPGPVPVGGMWWHPALDFFGELSEVYGECWLDAVAAKRGTGAARATWAQVPWRLIEGLTNQTELAKIRRQRSRLKSFLMPTFAVLSVLPRLSTPAPRPAEAAEPGQIEGEGDVYEERLRAEVVSAAVSISRDSEATELISILRQKPGASTQGAGQRHGLEMMLLVARSDSRPLPQVEEAPALPPEPRPSSRLEEWTRISVLIPG
eukprot:s40_g21.t1